MSFPAPRNCPVCSNTLTLTRLDCRTCGTSLTGAFNFSGLSQLTPEQLSFVETFVKCEGKLNRMEKEVGMSYPTLRSRLHEIIIALGYPVGKRSSPGLSEAERAAILDALAQGEISAEEAMEKLKGE